MQHDDTRQYDLDSFYTEARLTHTLHRGLGVQAEYGDGSGRDNSVGRFGLVYKVPLASHFVSLRGFPLETDGDGGQLSAAWSFSPLDPRIFIEGFLDYNFSQNGKRIVSESQLRYMLDRQLGLTLEYRLNEFLSGPGQDDTGLALGLYYSF